MWSEGTLESSNFISPYVPLKLKMPSIQAAASDDRNMSGKDIRDVDAISIVNFMSCRLCDFLADVVHKNGQERACAVPSRTLGDSRSESGVLWLRRRRLDSCLNKSSIG